MKKLRWRMAKAWRRFQAWRRRRNPELRELDAFRECLRLERKAKEYPRAVPLLMALLRAYRATGQEDRMREVMRRLRDTDPLPVPDFMWDEQPPVKVMRVNVAAWCRRIEAFIRERRLKSVHLQHVQGILRTSCHNASIVCAALERRGVLGPYDGATGRRRVLEGAA